jgi:hypothetical protein
MSNAQRVARRFLADRSKKINLGFVVIDTHTGEYLSDVFTKREPPRTIAKELYQSGREHVGVHTLEAHVPASWKRGDPLEGYVEPHVLEKLRQSKLLK